jgi:hypothetical protein
VERNNAVEATLFAAFQNSLLVARGRRQAAGHTGFSGFSQPRQCGDEVLRILVTGGPPVRGGGGIPQRIVVSSLPSAVFRTTGTG